MKKLMKHSMKIRHCVLAVLLPTLCTVLLANANFAQSADSQSRPGQQRSTPLPVLSGADLVLSYFSPREASASELFYAIRPLYARTFMVESEAGGASRRVENMSLFGEMIICYDTENQVNRMVAAMVDIEAAARAHQEQVAAANDETETLVSASYRPGFVSLETLRMALEPFAREVVLDERDGDEWEHYSPNLAVIEEPATILIRDTQSNVDLILARLESLDRPLPQVMLTAYVLSPAGFHDQAKTGAVPEELVSNLAKLTPYDSFVSLAVSSIRTNVSSAQNALLTLGGAMGPTGDFGLELRQLAFDKKTHTLSVGECLLNRHLLDPSRTVLLGPSKTVLRTSFTAYEGEFAVIGLTGEVPLLLALTFQSVPSRM